MTANLTEWPELPLAAWADTFATVHRWFQIVGKVRMINTPPINHSWHVTLYVSPRGLTTGTVPADGNAFDIEFDFLDHQLVVRRADGRRLSMPLAGQSVASFYRELQRMARECALPCAIYPCPNELPDATPFIEDEAHRTYDGEYAQRFWRILLGSDRVLRQFRSRFIGKCSPVHFFWGAADLAVTRFSGRPAPLHPGGIPNLPDAVTREAYSHEVSSAGFWPGTAPIDYPAFYSYAYPAPAGFAAAAVRPEAAFYSKDFGEFILPYDAVRTAASPDAVLMEFLTSTYEAAATLGRWDRAALER